MEWSCNVDWREETRRRETTARIKEKVFVCASRYAGGWAHSKRDTTTKVPLRLVPAEVSVGDEEHIVVVSIELGNIIDRHLCRVLEEKSRDKRPEETRMGKKAGAED